MRKLLCLLAALMLLSACAQEPRPERVTDEELAALREDYPVVEYGYGSLSNGPSLETLVESGLYTTPESLMADPEHPYYAAVIVTLQGEWRQLTGYASPFGDPVWDEALPSSAGQITWEVLDAEIDEILWGGEGLAVGDTITVGFGDVGFLGAYPLEETFLPGGRYVFFLTPSTIFDEPAYGAARSSAYYLTGDDVALSVENLPGAEALSGYYLPAFRGELQQMLQDITPRALETGEYVQPNETE